MRVSTIPVRGVTRSISGDERARVCARAYTYTPVRVRHATRTLALARSHTHAYARAHSYVTSVHGAAEVFRWMLEEQGAAQPTSPELPTNITV